MEEKAITLREILTPEEIRRYWKAQDEMNLRDVFPNTDIGVPPAPEERSWFLGSGFHGYMDEMCTRAVDRAHRFFFCEGEREVGFVMLCIFGSQDGRCYIVNFCIDPDLRCRGLGSRCYRAVEQWAKAQGAQYCELNTHSRRSLEFWKRLGFCYNGFDEYGSILVCAPPQIMGPVEVSLLPAQTTEEMRHQLCKLENGFMTDMGEESMGSDRWERLIAAVEAEQIRFFVAWRGCRAIGMCSVSLSFSTESCGEVGFLGNLFVEPVFRGHGVARKLVQAVRAWAGNRALGGLLVGCSEEYVPLYRALGFDEPEGVVLADNG
jgi:GNAT superfamily N-acetyltransferase